MTREELHKWLAEEQQKWELLLEAIGERRMELAGVNKTGNWSMRDLIVHLTVWQRWLVLRLSAAAHGRLEPAPPWPASLIAQDDINGWIYESNRDRNLKDVLTNAHDVFQQTLSAVRDLPEPLLIETIDAKFHALRFGDQRLAPGEFFHHFYDDHGPAVRAWLERIQ